jgi:hypothetical protein
MDGCGVVLGPAFCNLWGQSGTHSAVAVVITSFPNACDWLKANGAAALKSNCALHPDATVVTLLDVTGTAQVARAVKTENQCEAVSFATAGNGDAQFHLNASGDRITSTVSVGFPGPDGFVDGNLDVPVIQLDGLDACALGSPSDRCQSATCVH